MIPSKFFLEVLDSRYLTRDVKEIDVSKPLDKTHLAGQFMTINIKDGNTPLCMRSYSVLSSLDNKYLQLCVKLVDGGRGSSWLFDLKKGDELEVFYPSGRFVLPENLLDTLVFIGTGTGIVPLLCMMESFDLSFDKNVKVIFGVRYKEDLFYVDRILKLKEKIKNFDVVFTLSRPDVDWDFAKGRVTEHLGDINLNAQYFVCGSGDLVKDTKLLLESGGVLEKNIFYENYG